MGEEGVICHMILAMEGERREAHALAALLDDGMADVTLPKIPTIHGEAPRISPQHAPGLLIDGKQVDMVRSKQY